MPPVWAVCELVQCPFIYFLSLVFLLYLSVAAALLPLSLLSPKGSHPPWLSGLPETFPEAVLPVDFPDAEFSCKISPTDSYSSCGSAGEQGGQIHPALSVTNYVVYAHPCFSSALSPAAPLVFLGPGWLLAPTVSISFHHQGPDLKAAVKRSHPFRVRISLCSCKSVSL